jgi:hypothetical protein
MIDRPERADLLPHDKLVCIAAAQEVASSRNGGSFVLDDRPDERERTRKAVDVIGHDDIGTLTVEHTLIESYVQQTYDNSRIAQLREEIEARFTDPLEGPGRYTLCLHTRGAAAIPPRKLLGAVEQLQAWVRSQRLPVPEIPPRTPNHVEAVPPDVPIPVTLFRMQCSPKDDGSLVVALLRDDDLEGLRLQRVESAIVSKGQKLEDWRQAEGITLLALENQDFVMAYPVVIARAVYDACQSFSPVPDCIVCVDTTAGDGAWLAYRIKMHDWWADSAVDNT